MSRLNSIIVSGAIALSACTTAAQPKVEQRLKSQATTPERWAGESMHHYLERLGIHDPASANRERESEKIFKEMNERIAVIMAEVFWGQVAHQVKNCLHAQQYDATSEEQRKAKCADEALNSIDQNENFRNIDSNMQEMIREQLWKNIMEK